MQIRNLILKDVGPFADLDMSFPEGTDPARADVHLLVGPNGTGKSSVLSALAQCWSFSTHTGFEERARSREAMAIIRTELGWHGVAATHRDERWGVAMIDGTRLAPYSDEQHDVLQFLGARPRPTFSRSNARAHQMTDAAEEAKLPLGIRKYRRLQREVLGGIGKHEAGTSFAVFAYGGLRRTSHERVDSIREQIENPLADSCAFLHREGTLPLIQWIANTVARKSLYTTTGAAEKASARAQALDRLSAAIGSIIGQNVELNFEIDPFQVGLSVDGGPPVEIHLLPDGLQSILSWLGDLLMRLDRIPWSEPGPVTDRRFILLLDEVEVHLHPAWQRRVIPVVERLFPNAQIIASTHSPFVIASASDAWIHRFRLEGGKAVVDAARPTAKGMSYPAILDDLMGVSEEFDVESLELLASFRELWTERLRGGPEVEPRLMEKVRALASRSLELESVVATEMHDLRKRLARKEGQPA